MTSATLTTSAVPSTALPFLSTLRDHGDRTAIIDESGSLSYAALADRVDEAARDWLGIAPGRRLVQVELVPTADAVISYLGALAAGHVVIVAASGRSADIESTYQPDSVARAADDTWTVAHRRSESGHELHPDLLLLLSTSGSTGSPKLVRLSTTNVAANTTSITTGLGITADDVAVTTLPLHYCYGLSVLHSHLAVGARILLTSASVTDPHLWATMREHGVTTLSGVPHTFDLISAVGRSPGDLPTMRQVTQAGGRLAPDVVADLARRGHCEGWQLRVMYGQTEATARMCIASADEVLRHPERVGRPVCGGRFRVVPDGATRDDQRVGELCYRGPNVMMGYAQQPSDLALDRTVTELNTGDLARLHDDGTVEIIGRRDGFLKIAGLRIDIGRIEEALTRAGHEAVVMGTDEQVRVLVSPAAPPESVTRSLVRDVTGLPDHRIGVVVADIPRTPAGKPDRAAALTAYEEGAAGRLREEPEDTLTAIIETYAVCLGRPEAGPGSTFIGLEGDSLSYVEVAVRLESRIGTLPADWPARTVRELATLGERNRAASGGTRSRRSRIAHVDTTVVLRGLAITMIVLTHTKIATVLGGAHILLAVAGFNFARFAGVIPRISSRVRAASSTVLKIAVPTAVWVAGVAVTTGSYSWANALLVNWLFGPDRWTSNWQLWFIEALVWILVGVVALLSIHRVHAWHARSPFAVAATVAAVGLLARLDVFDLTSPPGRGTAPAVLWLFAFGWAASHAVHRRQKLVLCGILAVGMPGFMGNSVREATIAAGLLVLLWLPSLPVPRIVVPVLGVIASSSLYIYLTHFEVYRSTSVPVVNFLLGIALGIATWFTVSRATSLLSRRRNPSSRPPVSPDHHPSRPVKELTR